MKFRLFYTLLLSIVLISCNTTKKTAVTIVEPETAEPHITVDSTITEKRDLDTVVVTAPRESPEIVVNNTLPPYNPSPKRTNDLLHTKLDLKFDWEQEAVHGKATLELEPYFYPTEVVTLDAKGFDFHKVQLLGEEADLTYEYDGTQIIIQLGRAFEKGEKYELYIEYTASPAERTGGSAAITSDQGLFFVNPRAEEAGKPQQIWTQGETEWNSNWFPTIDKPNERCTQEMLLTVSNKYTTLSNGLLLKSTDNGDGTRTDYWKMDQPHAPYLFMLVVGEYAVVKDKWKDIDVDYYVEKEYESSARSIFSNTLEMLDFFSERLDFKYPWPKYAQIVVRDYVSGAMENTTSSIFGEFVQRHERELIDNHNERIVAHELFHHWFGDYVTCESWANLTMNEGFANYSEYLWLEHKYGRDEADYHLLNEMEGYFSSSQGNFHPLIHFGYQDKEDMFDAHSYNKGGAVLHMLKEYVGDAAFWAALNKYLEDNAYRSVEVHDLRLAFEAVTGEDLNWFFNQWYLEQGHPVLEVTYGYDETKQLVTVTIDQVQDPEKSLSIFRIPTHVDIYFNDGEKPLTKSIVLDERSQTFEFEVPSEPQLINLDPKKVLLVELEDNKTDEEYIFQFYNSPAFLDRYEAVARLRYSDKGKKVYEDALEDDFWVIRGIALQNLSKVDEAIKPLIRSLAKEDPKSQIRSTALLKLAEVEDPQVVDLAKHVINNELAYPVIAAALDVLIQSDKDEAITYAKKLEDIKNADILEVVGSLYAESGDPALLQFFEKNLTEVDGFQAISFYASYQGFAENLNRETALTAMKKLQKIAVNMGQSSWRRLAAAKSVNDMRNFYRETANGSEDEELKNDYEERVDVLTEILEEIKSREENKSLREIYNTRLLLIDRE